MVKTALLLIDVQRGFDPSLYESFWGRRNNPSCEENIKLLLDAARACTEPTPVQVIHVVHDSKIKDSPLNPATNPDGNEMVFQPIEGEPVFRKSVNSSFIGTSLQSFLEANDIANLICVGLTTDHCVNTTVRMGSNLGFRITIVPDAVACHDRVSFTGKLWDAQTVHDVSLASLTHGNEFCDAKLTSELISNSFA